MSDREGKKLPTIASANSDATNHINIGEEGDLYSSVDHSKDQVGVDHKGEAKKDGIKRQQARD